jgi:hypothetical protein
MYWDYSMLYTATEFFDFEFGLTVHFYVGIEIKWVALFPSSYILLI